MAEQRTAEDVSELRRRAAWSFRAILQRASEDLEHVARRAAERDELEACIDRLYEWASLMDAAVSGDLDDIEQCETDALVLMVGGGDAAFKDEIESLEHWIGRRDQINHEQ